MLAAAAGCFAAGTGVGLLIPRFAEPDAMPWGEQEEYEQRRIQDEDHVCKLVADYGLTDSQARSLRLIMQNQLEQEIALRLSAAADELSEATKHRLRSLSLQTTRRILAVLDPQQRARYDLESRPGPGVGPEQGGPTTATNR